MNKWLSSVVDKLYAKWRNVSVHSFGDMAINRKGADVKEQLKNFGLHGTDWTEEMGGTIANTIIFP